MERHVRTSQDLAELQPAEMIDANGIVHKEFVPPGRTVNQQFYLKVLKRLRDSVRRKKRPEMWSRGDWFLHHDNAPAHTALRVQQCSAKKTT